MSDAALGQATPAAQPAPQAPKAPGPSDLRGVPDTVARVQRLLEAEKAPAAEPAAPKEQPAAQPEAQPEEPEAPVGPNKQAEGDQPPPEDAQAQAEIPLDQLESITLDVTVKGEDGKDITEKVSIKELREGRMRQADYSRKTAELARQREQLSQETRKAVEEGRTTALKELQTMHDLVMQTAAAELADVNWNDLATNNAFEYVRLDNRRKQITQTLDAIKGKQAEILTKHEAEQKTAKQEAATKARTQLESDIPGFNDALYQKLLKFGIEKAGFKQEEVATWIDPRAIKLLHKASLYDESQAEKTQPAAEKKVVVAPTKVIRPGATNTTANPVAQRERAAMQQLQKSGKIQDAAAVIRNRFG